MSLLQSISGGTEPTIKLAPIEESYACEIEYLNYPKVQNFEKIYDNLNRIKIASGVKYSYNFNGKSRDLILAGFKIITVTPIMNCEDVSEEEAATLYKEEVALKLNKKRCRLNKIIKQLDISKLNETALSSLERIVN